MTFYSVLGSVQGELEPPILVNEGEAFDLAKRGVYKNESHGKLLKAPKKATFEGALESLTRGSFLYKHLLAKVQHLCSNTTPMLLVNYTLLKVV
jgi:hypothetical protein